MTRYSHVSFTELLDMDYRMLGMLGDEIEAIIEKETKSN